MFFVYNKPYMATKESKNKKTRAPKRTLSSYIFSTLLVFATLVALYSLIAGDGTKKAGVVGLSEVARLVQAGEIKTIVVDSQNLTAIKADDTKITSKKEPDASLIETLVAYGVDKDKLAGVDISIKAPSTLAIFFGTIFPILLPLGLIIFFIWMSQSLRLQEEET